MTTTAMISLDQIDIPADARSHDPAALEILAHDMGEQGQLQEIIVCMKGEGGGEKNRYEVIAGVGRTLAARKLGWKEIRASIREAVSDFDRARITFAENEDREDVDPFYQAGLMSKMLKAKGCKQGELAKELGLSDALISAYVAVNALPPKISENFRRLKLGQLTQIARLNNAKSQIALAKKSVDQDLSVRQLKAIVDKKLGNSPALSLLRSVPLE